MLPLKARMMKSELESSRGSPIRMCDMTPLKGYYIKLHTSHHRMLLRIIGAWCKPPNRRILSHKDAPQQTECDIIETTVRTRRLLWSGALFRMGDHRLPKKVTSGEVENMGRGERKNNGRTARQRIVVYLRSWGTGAPPHLTLRSGTAQYVKGAVGLWCRVGKGRGWRPNTGRGKEKRKRRKRLRLHLG